MNINLLKKIAALATGGVGGERDNAQRQLERILSEEGQTMDDLDNILREVSEEWMTLKFKNATERRICDTCVVLALQTLNVNNQKGPGGKSKRYRVPATKVTEIEVKAERAKAAWRKELDLFFVAFMNKQGLVFSDEDDDDNCGLSSAEIQAICEMMGSIRRVTFNKQLGGE